MDTPPRPDTVLSFLPAWAADIDWGVVAIVGAGTLIVVAQMYWQAWRSRRVLRPAARRLGGRIIGSRLSGYYLTFTLDGAAGRLDCTAETPRRAGRTTLRLDATGTGTLQVMDHGLFNGLVEKLDGPDIRIGDAMFDARYRVLGEPPEWVRTTLDDLTRARIGRVADLKSGLLQFAGVELRAGLSGLRLEVRRDLSRDPQALEEFAAEGLEIFRRLRR